jgi:hypothetical protein
MDDKLNEKILDLVDDLGADDYEEGRAWNGYKVYIPVYDEESTVGLPLVILEKGGEVRISTGAEAMEYLDYESTERAQDMDTDTLSRVQKVNID